MVNHEQRREELARAVWAVVVRSGVEAASVRTVAAEAGWSMGALRHYFSAQDELLRFALYAMTRRISLRVRHHLEHELRVQELLEELLPLDEERHGEALIWLAFMAKSRTDPQVDELRTTAWHGGRFISRVAVAHYAKVPLPQGNSIPLNDDALEREAEDLHTFIDGLTLQGANYPDQMPPVLQRELLRRQLDALRARVGEA
ncbi:MAG: TetR family transcriptional regulator [Corynebacteriales bacterium]|nr:TetR family transcriptional regulator [Mycobacteriales bacterium]